MYQSLINLLIESGYIKYMTAIGPVYIQEKKDGNQIIFLTYHKDQRKEPVYMRHYEDELQKMKETIFPDQLSNILCIMIVDDGELLEQQMAKSDVFSMWVVDEQTGKLYISKESNTKFAELFSVIEKKSIEAQQRLEKEKIQYEEENPAEELKQFVTPANMMIIAVNSILFVISQFVFPDLTDAWASEWSAILLDHEIYRLFTAMFIHFDLEHLLSNMLVLSLTGSFVERYVGSLPYTCAYLVCGLAGNMISFYFNVGNASIIFSAGASGAIYGVLGMLAVILWKTKGRINGIQGPGLVLFVIGMVFHSYQAEGIDNLAHLGGLAAGVIAGILLKRKNKIVE